METQDSNIENLTEDSVVKTQITATEVKCIPGTLEDHENMTMTTDFSEKPEKLKGVTSDDNGLTLSWDVPSCNLQVIKLFEIQWKETEVKGWSGRICTIDNSTNITIPIAQLETNTAYQFKVRWITNEGVESPFSDISDDIILKVFPKPGKPKGASSNEKDLLINWDVSSTDCQAVKVFEIKWKTKEEKVWSGTTKTEDNSTFIKIPITDLEKNTAYQFKVRWITTEGVESPFSVISDDIIITKSPQQPGKVSCLNTTATSACLSWEKPNGPDTVSYYEVKYRSLGDVQWLTVNTKHPTCSLDLKDLKSETNYEFKVRAIFSDGNEGSLSEISDTVTTQESLAKRLKKTAIKVTSTNTQIYKIPITFSDETTMKTAMTRKGRFGERDTFRSTKTIMVVGERGAGKSTMIDGMINYIVDVTWEDDFRFTITDPAEDEKATAVTQASSQTHWITCYEVNYQHGSRLDHNLNIIDTPGFGDVRGIEYDKKIVDQICEFFKAPGDQGIYSIDAVCFVVQAPLARLTYSQKYIFDYVLSFFGKDIQDNIFVLVTFADGKEPPVLAVLKEANVPFQQAFNFNNSALFECTHPSGQFTQVFWKLGITSFDNLFDKLHRVQQRSLQLTLEVVELRQHIENTIERLLPQIKKGLNLLNAIEKETEILQNNKRDKEANRNFTYVTETIEKRKVHDKPGKNFTNCSICDTTCHLECGYARDIEKEKCNAMGKDGYCTVCTGKCYWKKHKNDTFYYETHVVKVERTYDNLKAKYEYAVAGEQKQASKIDAIKSDLKNLNQMVMSMITRVKESVNKLEQVALKPTRLNEINHVQLLIDSEKREAKSGWESRVQMLEDNKRKAELVHMISTMSTDWTEEDIEKIYKTPGLTFSL